MRKVKVELDSLIRVMGQRNRKEYDSFKEVLKDAHIQFSLLCEMDNRENSYVITASNLEERNLIYDEIRFNAKTSKIMNVYYDRHNDLKLIVKSAFTAADLFKKEEGFLYVSSLLGVEFEIELIQHYTDTIFQSKVSNGILINQQLSVEVNVDYPLLSLGLLDFIVGNERDFKALGGQITLVESELLS